ncbi:MAG: tryptophan synthase subunit alpha [Phycisphaeraceae bacterium]|nr:tryptophan synthase subunit alpha [Phycisphaeraceae bacterium]
MNRITAIFEELRAQGRKALMPFLTGGDPDLETTRRLILAAQRQRASICEIGFPFSDPIADGPVIQASMHRALREGLRCSDLFEMVRSIRGELTIGLVAMVSFSLIHRQGIDRFTSTASESGFDGLIVPDLTVEEAAPLRAAAAAQNLTLSFLIAPTTPLERARKLAEASSGFIYLVSRSGVTGEQSQLPSDLTERIEPLRTVSSLPIAVGFGIAEPRQVEQVVSVADAAIVGSALVRRLEQHLDEPIDQRVEAVEALMAELSKGLATEQVRM